jgi:hypothetical protein
MLGRVALVATMLVTTAAAAAPSAADKAAAQGLFDQAQQAVAGGDFRRACGMLEESQRLDPQQGTQFHLAKCYEGSGRYASAWTLYIDVADSAKAAGQVDREKVARQRADAIAPRVPKLVITVPAGVTEVKRDGELAGSGQWGTPIPVDPGRHVIVASAPGKKTFEGSVDVKEGATQTFTIPALAAAPATAPPPSAPPPPPEAQPSGLGTQRILALAAGGIGVVGVGLGTVFGLSSKSKHDAAQPNCNGDVCNKDGLAARNDAISAGNLSTVFFVVGAAGLAGGATLWLTAPSSASSVGLAPAAGPGGAGVTLRGKW